jgi:hypothetical protein
MTNTAKNTGTNVTNHMSASQSEEFENQEGVGSVSSLMHIYM